jgi:AraC family transcriptional regulator
MINPSAPTTENEGTSDYARRVNRAIDYIVKNLSNSLSLAEIAHVAHFSPFHFHRIFKAATGETLHQFVKRLRLASAIQMLTPQPYKRQAMPLLTQIALACGFSSLSEFSHSFKQRYGASPRRFDIAALRNTHQAEFERFMAAITSPTRAPYREDFVVQLRDLPARSLAYIRVFNPYREGLVKKAYQQLYAKVPQSARNDAQWLGYMWDEPETVGLANCRYDAAVVVEDLSDVTGLSEFQLPAMRVAEIVIKGDLALEARAIEWLYQSWLPQSGYVPADHPAMEAWIGEPYQHGDDYFELAFQVPLRHSIFAPDSQ